MAREEMNPLDYLLGEIDLIEKRLGYSFTDKELLVLAFVHTSFYNENQSRMKGHNERLEFLGDSVLGLMVSDYLFRSLPNHPEGELSQLRASIVEASSCAHFLEKLNVAEYVLLGKGERYGSQRGRSSIHADLFEALIGAIFLDGGLEAARSFFFGHFQTKLLLQPVHNWKAELQDYAQRECGVAPQYEVIQESGPDHDKRFHIVVSIEGREVGRGVGSSKKAAETDAAEEGMSNL